MTTFQEYLNQKYPTQEEKNQVKEIITEAGDYEEEIYFESFWKKIGGGELDLSGFANLEKIDIDGEHLNSSLTKLNINNCPKLIEFHCLNNQLVELDVSCSSKLVKIGCSYNQLTGLKLDNSADLKELWCGRNRLTRLKLDNLINLENLNCSGNLLTNLQLNNHLQLKSINCEGNRLTKLVINNCPNLEKISCDGNRIVGNVITLGCEGNRITELDISGLPNLKELDCSNNLLTILDLTQNKKLEKLNIQSNNFAERDLSFLSHLVNLEVLWLGNDGYISSKICKCCPARENIYNRFIGSLEPLKNMINLEFLFIDDTDIDSGLEYLSDSLGKFYCEALSNRENAKVKVLEEELINYGCWNWGNQVHLLKGWKEEHPEIVNPIRVIQQAQKIEKLEDRFQELNEQLEQNKKEFQSQLKEQNIRLTTQSNLLQQISFKKTQRKQLLSDLSFSNNPDLIFWLNELITTAKKPNNLQSTILANIQTKLLELDISQEQIKELTELQQKISKLKQELKSEVEQQAQILHNPPK